MNLEKKISLELEEFLGIDRFDYSKLASKINALVELHVETDRAMLEQSHKALKEIMGDEYNGYGDPKYQERFYNRLCDYLSKPRFGEEE